MISLSGFACVYYLQKKRVGLKTAAAV